MFVKLGENLTFDVEQNTITPQQAFVDDDIAKRFVKLAKKLKKVAPKADDFVYFHAIMLHASEASLVDQATGEYKKNANGEPIDGRIETFKLADGRDSIRWVSKDGVKPYCNHNKDSFPEAELKKAYKKWVGKPLCVNHQSDSVDGIRGIIIDTYYDDKYKRVHGLCALDRKNYADLARKVETGYAMSVSMGTGVGFSVCSECGNKAATEKEYCNCIKARANYAELNTDLSPIELSIVVTPADPLAKVKRIIASMNEYADTKQKRIGELKAARCVNPTELQELEDSVNEIKIKLAKLTHIEKVAEVPEDLGELIAALRTVKDETLRTQLEEKIKSLLGTKEVPETTTDEEFEPQPSRSTVGGGSEYTTPEWLGTTSEIGLNPANRVANRKDKVKKEGGIQGAILNEISLLRSKLTDLDTKITKLNSKYLEDTSMNSARLKARAKTRRAYWLGGGGVNEPTPGKPKYEKEEADKIRDKEDKQMVGEPLETGSEGLHPGDEEVKKKLLRAEELEDRRMKRRAYWLGGGGVNEPTPGKPKYEKEEADKIRDKEDKQMVGEPLDTGSDGLHPGDEEVKKKLLRAKLSAKFVKVAGKDGGINKEASHWDVYAGDKLVLSANGSEIYGDELGEHWDYLNSKDYGKAVLKHIREEGFERTAYLLKGAQEPAPAPEAASAMPALPEVAAPAAPAAPAAEAPAAKEKPETQKKVDAALSAMEDKLAELRELVSGMSTGELVDVDVSLDKKPASGPMEGVLASREDLMKVEALMDLSADELAEASETLEGLAEVPVKVSKAVDDALADSDAILSKASLILEAAKKKKDKKEKKEEVKEDKKEEKDEKKEEVKEDKKEEKDEKKEASALLEKALKVRSENRAALLAKAMGVEQCACGDMACDGMHAEDVGQALEGAGLSVKEWAKEEAAETDHKAEDYAKDKKEDKEEKDEKEDKEEKDEEKEDKKEEKEDDAMYVEELPVMTLASRKTEREKLIAQAESVLGKYQLDLGPASNATEPTFYKAHPGGKGTVTELTGTKTPEAKVETISEVHDVMRDVAESGPRNVREAAMEIQEGIVKGAYKVEDLDKLVTEGKVDSEAASYWKKFWAQAPEGGQFGAEMSKEFAGKKKEAEDNTYRVKIRRAYDLALEAQDKGLIGAHRIDLDKYVDDVMTFDDAAFESTKRVVSSYKSNSKLTSGAVPSVGLGASTKPMEVTASVESKPDLVSQLLTLGWK